LILYLDTSCLSKLYLIEDGSHEVEAAVLDAERLVSSRIAYAETRVALARAWRNGRIDDAVFSAAKSEFEDSWQTVFVVEVTPAIVRDAAELGDKHPLRGFDAVHLASAVDFRIGEVRVVSFMTADRRLRDAASAEGFQVA